MDLSKFKERFEHESVKIMRDFNVPGMSILVTKDGETIYERSFGLRKRGDVKEATIDTLFGVSSITKSVTDFAILQLYEEGKLDLLDPISNHLPVEIGIKDQPIKIHDLMCHGSGVPSLMTFYMSQMNQQLYKPKSPLFPLGNWDDYYFHINDASSEVLSPPGTKYYYFNAGFTLLGQIVEKVSGIPFEQYIKEKILQPLNMKRST
ncbi:MAG: beta-lactamase family protein, partial [Candidatus Heimdallarchaeota archaeon]|nr:beta-lactamase family protein [Candidatus Heimdallarchaeota archaeon]